MRDQRIKIWMAWALIVTAMLVDLTEMGITWLGLVAVGGIVSEVLSIVASFLFWVWFQMLGISMSSNTKRFAVGLTSVIVEMIPGLDALPILSWMWTIGMIITVGMTRMEDNGEKPTVLGAIQNVLVGTSFNPALLATTAIKKRVFRRPQIKREEPNNGDTINESEDLEIAA